VRRLILRNFQSPGDVVMLTAAVRDLHAAYPGQFATGVRTSAAALWDHNPHVARLAEGAPGVRTLDMHYPLVHRSNTSPYHFLHGFTAYLSEQLGVPIAPTRFRGDIHLSGDERRWTPQVQERTGIPVPYWIVTSGGKTDFTTKWWSAERYQAVVDHFRGRLLFVQAGESHHVHPPLRGVLNLVGLTDVRQFVRLVHHADGVLGGVSFAMHLAAAVETPAGAPKNRACVVVAGGREPPHWEAYPHHQFLHTVGALRCCDDGGCWKARVRPLGDGSPNDDPRHRCVDVVGDLPRCMDVIRPDAVIAAIELYLAGGAVRTLTRAQAAAAQAVVASEPAEAALR
jgi:ADP-heptose:LPS heptosyltransferase